MKPLFIDSGPFVAIANRGDQFQPEAEAIWAEIAVTSRPLISSDHVLDEVATAICRTQDPARAARWVRLQLTGDFIRWIQPGLDELAEATHWLEKLSDQNVNFTDALSFVLMRREKIAEAFTFDRHFAFAGFHVWPAR
ncbi:MAG: type II toxin-antitoxin system VapC family toxin [Verrucomicrobiales bacterium]